ncbi:aldolase [Nocardioides gansuensis]|uniref:3-oxo-tetronate 4-phosphate decarboxylase n=1 Tax=Nocardioides gansuensis TaxID=2138300 RepID=A0A2T8FBR9_9ACTN|nr:3-oxo-tetronate 4-phosphate decarboxylase [Nocardioides gansuensis]PVG83159.1 aldolase [Nocardioides gansuensis]
MNAHGAGVGAVAEDIARLGASIFARGLTPGRTGNLSCRIGDEIVVTPTGASLGSLDPCQLAIIDLEGRPISGAQPSKEAGMHAALYRARPTARGIVHLHSTHAVAVSCLADLDERSALPPLTAYFAMRVGRLPLVPYFAPGDPALSVAVEEMAREHHAMLLANHGSVVAADDLLSAADAAEEIEETARLRLLLGDSPTRPLTSAQLGALAQRKERA